jgi:streptogramin lyase
VERIDPRRNRVTARVRIGRNTCGLVAAFGSLWTARWDPSEVVRVDPRTRRVVHIRVPKAAFAVAATRDAVWVSSFDSNSVSRVDPRTNRVVETVRVGAYASDLAVVGNALWIGTGRESRDVLRLDLRTRELARVPLGARAPAAFAAAGASGIWVSTAENTVMRVDPATRAVVATLDVPATPAHGTFARDGTVWLASKEANAVTRIDPVLNRVIDSVPAGPGAFDVLAAFGSYWVPSYAGSDVLRFAAR